MDRTAVVNWKYKTGTVCKVNFFSGTITVLRLPAGVFNKPFQKG
jgi:hypothetical protein